MATSTELRDWLAAAQTRELLRRTAHWVDEAIKDPDIGTPSWLASQPKEPKRAG